jgi:hypothetical protein
MDTDSQAPPLINWAAYAADTARFAEYVPPQLPFQLEPVSTNIDNQMAQAPSQSRKRTVEFVIGTQDEAAGTTQLIMARSGARPCSWCGLSCERMISVAPVAQIQQFLYTQIKDREFGHYECLFSACSDLIEHGRDDVRDRLRSLLERYSGSSAPIFYVKNNF